ncbi:MAG: hypothetical protein ACI90U_002668 [Pseudomonadales bacterium]|jgi:hypothetical protein
MFLFAKQRKHWELENLSWTNESASFEKSTMVFATGNTNDPIPKKNREFEKSLWRVEEEKKCKKGLPIS